MAREVEYSGGGLTKRHTRGGWRWCGQVRYRNAGEKGWRTRLKALEGPDGSPIMADPDRTGPDGARVRTTRGIRAAQAAYDAWRASLDRREYDAGSTVADYVRADVEARRAALAGSTARGYLEYVPIMADGLGGVTMAQLDAKAVRLWVRHMAARGLAPATMRKAFAILSQVCDRAVENGDMAANPCTARIRRAEIPDSPTTEPNALDAAGVRRVNGLLDDARNPRLRVGARLALACGLRAGEASGLRWRDVDVPGRVLHVRESVANVGGGTEAKAPKSYAGTRDVPMPGAVALELGEWRAAQLAEWERAWTRPDGSTDPGAVPFDGCRVLGWPDGRPFTPNALGHLWHRLAAGARPRDPADRRRRLAEGWEPGREPVTGTAGGVVRLHDLRHTYATHLIASGADVRSVAALMGHADPSVTMRRYAAALAEARGRAQAQAAPVLTAGTRYAPRAV